MRGPVRAARRFGWNDAVAEWSSARPSPRQRHGRGMFRDDAGRPDRYRLAPDHRRSRYAPLHRRRLPARPASRPRAMSPSPPANRRAVQAKRVPNGAASAVPYRIVPALSLDQLETASLAPCAIGTSGLAMYPDERVRGRPIPMPHAAGAAAAGPRPARDLRYLAGLRLGGESKAYRKGRRTDPAPLFWSSNDQSGDRPSALVTSALI